MQRLAAERERYLRAVPLASREQLNYDMFLSNWQPIASLIALETRSALHCRLPFADSSSSSLNVILVTLNSALLSFT